MRQAIAGVSKEYQPSPFFEQDVGFFLDELEWIAGYGIESLEEYTELERYGRKVPLSASYRRVVWQILEKYRSLRLDSGPLYDWYDIASAVRAQLAGDSREQRYRHIVIDEGQDLSPEAIRSLVEAANPNGSITFFGDYAQQIYGQDLSWRACGLKVRKVERFQDNYRNTAEISRLAIAMSEMPQFGGDPADLVEPRAPTAAGPLPALVKCATRSDEVKVVQRLAKDFGQTGTAAVLARTWADARRACAGMTVRKLHSEMALWDASPGIYAGAYHSAKGLEFDAVLLPFCNADSVPHPQVVLAFGDAEATAREAKLLYVGVTRARTDLIVTYSNALTPLLPDQDYLWDRTSP